MGTTSTDFDVVVIGGGPVGLLTAFALQRTGVSTCVVERLDKKTMPMYGRACTLYPRTLEVLDQVGLLDDFLQIGLVARNGVNFDRRGKRVNDRGWQQVFSQFRGTFLDHFLNIRLKYSEGIIQAAYERGGGTMLIGSELKDLKVLQNTNNAYRISAYVGAVGSSAVEELRCKYLVGADGGSSFVRSLSGVGFNADATIYRWLRIDGVVKTNMPDSRIGVAAIESASHGNVLWVPLDHGRTRVGIALSKEMYEKYGDQMTQEQAMHEAIESVRPFELKYESVDWFTTYRRGVAENYMVDDCIFLAGDACHTHSSGAAQGMNTGVHDAINLSWKLAGVIHGWFKPEILHTYESERRPVAQTLIQQDRDYSSLISGDTSNKGSGKDANQMLANLMRDSATFVSGVGISYDENLINQITNSGCLSAGKRPDDALLYGPGRTVPVRLQQVTPNTGSFWVLVFTGNPEFTRPRLKALREHLDSDRSLAQKLPTGLAKYITIIHGRKAQPEESLGMPPFGTVYYDHDAMVQERYGFTETEGGIAVLRPDGYLGFATALDQGPEVDSYFRAFVVEPGISTSSRLQNHLS